MDNLKDSYQIKSWTISEVVEDLSREGFKVTAQQIRKYESQKLISPINKDASSGYRLFEYRDISRLRLILTLRLFGSSIKSIGRFFKLIDHYSPETNPKISYFKTLEPKVYSKELDVVLDFINEFLSLSNKMTSALRKSVEQFEEMKKKFENEKG